MTTSKGHSLPGETTETTVLGRTEQKATIVGSVLGGVAGAAVIHQTVAPLYLRYVALIVGLGGGSTARGVVAFVGVAAVFGALFGALCARHAATATDRLMTLAKRTARTRSVAAPFFRGAPLTTTTTLLGALYGALLGVLVGRIAVPALVSGATPFAFELSRTDPGILLGFVAYGAVLGLGYGRTVEGSRSTRAGGQLLGNGTRRLVIGPLVGGLAGGATLQVLAPGHLAALALVGGGGPTAAGSWGVWIVLSYVLSLVFVGTVARTVGRGPGYVRGLVSTGFAYGVVLAVALGTFAVPHLVSRVTNATLAVPNLNPWVIAGYVLFGTALGAAYGSTVANGSVLPRVVRDHRDAVAFSSLLGGLVGGGVVSQVAGPAQLLYYGSIAGNAGSALRSWLVWMALALLLGVCFVRFVRPRDESPGYLWRSTRRGLFFGLFAGIVVGGMLLPALVNARTEFTLPVPHLDPMVLAGYILFGGIVGAGFGASFDDAGLASGADRTKATIFGSLLGGLVGGLVIHHLAGPVHIQYVGALFRVPGSIAKSWATWLLLSLVFGAGYGRLVSGSMNRYVDRVASATAENPDLRAVLKPLLDRAPLTTTGGLLGTGYGLVLGLVVGLLVVPMVVTLGTEFVYPYPSTNLAVLFGYVVFGAFLGAGHGSMLES